MAGHFEGVHGTWVTEKHVNGWGLPARWVLKASDPRVGLQGLRNEVAVLLGTGIHFYCQGVSLVAVDLYSLALPDLPVKSGGFHF